LEEQAADVGEQRAILARDALLRDKDEELPHDGLEIFSGAQFGRGAEKFGGNGVGISAIEIFKLLLVDGTKSSGGSKERIGAAPAVSGSEAATFGLRYWGFFGHFGDSSKFLRNLYPPTRHFLYVLSLEDLGDTPRVCIEPKGVIRLRRGFGGLGCILNL
jgi:hypothetical protein